MLEKFDVGIEPINDRKKYTCDYYKLVYIVFDIVSDGVKFDNGNDGRFEFSTLDLDDLLDTADDFLKGDIKEDKELKFPIRYRQGDLVYNGFFFNVIVSDKGDDYWLFNYCGEHLYRFEPDTSIFSCRLYADDVKHMRDTLCDQIAQIDWDSYGLTEYYNFTAPDIDYEWCYSAKNLENLLNELIVGKELINIYVDEIAYNVPLNMCVNAINSLSGPRVILEFDDFYVDLNVVCEGTIDYRILNKKDVKVEKCLDNKPPNNKCMCEPGYVFDPAYNNKVVKSVKVRPTEYGCPWGIPSFDDSKVGDPPELPHVISLILSDEWTISIFGQDDDYVIVMHKTENIDTASCLYKLAKVESWSNCRYRICKLNDL